MPAAARIPLLCIALASLAAPAHAFDGLREARAGFATSAVASNYVAGDPAEAPPEGSPFELMRYRSPAGALSAYLTRDPGDGKKHPAVLWAHGGFGSVDLSTPEECAR